MTNSNYVFQPEIQKSSPHDRGIAYSRKVFLYVLGRSTYTDSAIVHWTTWLPLNGES